ncbi:hypothetical protein CL614_02375 [archaeon]|nr:hypothetical protein [archaeon]|tara:strand:+ start:1611 stop:2708 length:1098 start_codon:yes stop_codon:yes gene_type:complete
MDEENNSTKDENHEEKHEERSESRDSVFSEPSSKSKSTVWKPIALIMTVLFIISVGAYVFVPSTGMATGGTLSEADASAAAITYVSENLVSPDVAVNVTEITTQGGFYKINIALTSDDFTQEVESFLSLDGQYFFPSGYDVDEEIETPEVTTSIPAEVVKADKPNVELFVMSHCPYGTQAEKGILPVVDLLGDKIDFELKFVYYAMHPTQGEVEEQLNQYCIQKEQNDKFLDYLTCFLDEGDSPACIDNGGIDQAKLDACYDATDEEFNVIANLDDTSSWLSGRFPLFDIHKAENELYSVGGSPTLVINGQSVSSSRDPASLLATICGAFNEAPAECDEELTSASPSPGFGYGTVAASNPDALCQ